MSKTHISQTYVKALQTQNLQTAIAKTQSKTHLKGLIGSSFSFVLSEAFKNANNTFLVIFDDKEEAAHQQSSGGGGTR